jgi:hypothetical protein
VSRRITDCPAAPPDVLLAIYMGSSSSNVSLSFATLARSWLEFFRSRLGACQPFKKRTVVVVVVIVVSCCISGSN